MKCGQKREDVVNVVCIKYKFPKICLHILLCPLRPARGPAFDGFKQLGQDGGS